MQRVILPFLFLASLAAALTAVFAISTHPDTPTASLALEGSDIVWTIDVDPLEPTVGDAVVVTAMASGLGFIPKYSLAVAPEGESAPLVLDPEQETPPYPYMPSLGFAQTWNLTAVRAGEASLWVSVYYDKPFCLDDPPRCSTHFVSSTSGVLTVHIAPGPAPTASQTSTPTPTPTPTPFIVKENLPGDVNCDMAITSVDASLVLQYSAGLIDGLECGDLGDLNKDCAVNAIDALMILQISAGLTEIPPYNPCPTR